MVGTARSELAVILMQITLCLHRIHGFGFHFHHGRDVNKHIGFEVAKFRLVGFKEIKVRGCDSAECAGNTCSRR